MKDAKGHGSDPRNAGGSQASRERGAIDAIHARTSAAHQARVEMIGRAVGTVKEFARNDSGRGEPIPLGFIHSRDVDSAHDVLSDLAQVHHNHGSVALDHLASLVKFLGCMATLAALTWIWSACT